MISLDDKFAEIKTLDDLHNINTLLIRNIADKLPKTDHYILMMNCCIMAILKLVKQYNNSDQNYKEFADILNNLSVSLDEYFGLLLMQIAENEKEKEKD